MTSDDALRAIERKARGRTRYAGAPEDPADVLADEVRRLRKALREVMIGGNHLATIIGDHPPVDTSYEAALNYYGSGDAYEAWCCWRSIMLARAALEGKDA